MKRASKAAVFKQQVIIFTSEECGRLKTHLDGLSHTLCEVEGCVINKIGAPTST
jgi:hypothetical protein